MAKVAPDGLETFLAVVQAGSFSGAARRQNLTQSTISTRIRELETALDRTLFHRTTRQVRLTPDGRRLVGHARRVLAELQALSTDLGPDRPLTGVIRLGLPELMAVHWLPGFAARVGRAHPGLTLEYEVGLHPVLLNGMYRGELDLAIFARTGADDEKVVVEVAHGVGSLRRLVGGDGAYRDSDSGRLSLFRRGLSARHRRGGNPGRFFCG